MKEKRVIRDRFFYHIFNKSISNFGIFQNDSNKKQLLRAFDFYNSIIRKSSLSVFLRTNKDYYPDLLIPKADSIVKIISYCVMPDHYHFLIKVLKEKCVSKYMNDVENSFSRFFNTRFNRKGPLWQSSFESVRIRTNEQLLHVSRYIHLNPTTKNLVAKPEDWIFSSYRNFINNEIVLREMVPEISIRSRVNYKKFIEDRIDYQKKLKSIRKLTLE